MNAALYVRVSTADQDTAGQLKALSAFASARGWQATEYVDHGARQEEQGRSPGGQQVYRSLPTGPGHGHPLLK